MHGIQLCKPVLTLLLLASRVLSFAARDERAEARVAGLLQRVVNADFAVVIAHQHDLCLPLGSSQHRTEDLGTTLNIYS